MKRRSYTSTSKHPTLYCDNPNCDNVGIKLYILEDKVIQFLKKWLSGYYFEYDSIIEQVSSNKIKFLEKNKLSLEQEMKKEEEKIVRIHELVENGTYTSEIFKHRLSAISEKKMRIEKSIQENNDNLNQEKKIYTKRKRSIPRIENIMDIYDLLETPEEKNDLLKIIIKKITYLKTEKSIKKDSDPTNFIINLYPKIGNINNNSQESIEK